MTNRDLVISIANRMPVDASLDDIYREIALVAGVNQGLAEAKRGESVSAEEARRLIKVWTSEPS